MANRLYVDGSAAVGGDDLNQFVQAVGSVSLLRNFVGTTLDDTTPMLVWLEGLATTGDGGQGFFYWNANNASTDDGVDVIVPNGAGSGAWQRVIDTAPSTLTIVHLSSNYAILPADSGTHFDNSGASGTIVATLPAAADGLYYCFAVALGYTFQISASGGSVIWLGSTETATSGNVSSSTIFSSICMEAHGGVWVVSSTVGTWSVN